MKKNKMYLAVALTTLGLGLILLFISAIINGWNFYNWIHDQKTITGIVSTISDILTSIKDFLVKIFSGLWGGD